MAAVHLQCVADRRMATDQMLFLRAWIDIGCSSMLWVHWWTSTTFSNNIRRWRSLDVKFQTSTALKHANMERINENVHCIYMNSIGLVRERDLMERNVCTGKGCTNRREWPIPLEFEREIQLKAKQQGNIWNGKGISNVNEKDDMVSAQNKGEI